MCRCVELLCVRPFWPADYYYMYSLFLLPAKLEFNKYITKTLPQPNQQHLHIIFVSFSTFSFTLLCWCYFYCERILWPFLVSLRPRLGRFMTRFVTKTKIFGNMSTFNCLIVLFLAFYCNADTFYERTTFSILLSSTQFSSVFLWLNYLNAFYFACGYNNKQIIEVEIMISLAMDPGAWFCNKLLSFWYFCSLRILFNS